MAKDDLCSDDPFAVDSKDRGLENAAAHALDDEL